MEDKAMKKNLLLILAASAVIASALSCQKIEQSVVPVDGNNVFELTVGASFGLPDTRALTEDGNVLSATFATTENIYAYNATTSTMLGGSLNPQSDGASTVLQGTLTGTINNGDNLRLIYLKNAIDYSSQDGTLSGIAAGFDYATADVTVNEVSTPTVTTSPAKFVPQQSITKFTFSTPVKTVTISGAGLVQSVTSTGEETTGNVTVTLDSPSATVYVALRNSSTDKVSYVFDATDGDGKTYQGSKKATLAAAKNYATSVILHEYVDLGLAAKWATCNIGATTPTEAGDYYAWGETETYYDGEALPIVNPELSEEPPMNWKTGKTNGYVWASYKFGVFNNSAADKGFSKYSSDGLTRLEPVDDAAVVNWGGSWQMPEMADLNELKNNCTFEWKTDYNGSGVSGYLCTSKNNNKSIFLPASGFLIRRDGVRQLNAQGYYWASTLVSNVSRGRTLKFTADATPTVSYNDRYYGLTIRPVIKE